jgi:hypothetical protein
MRLVTHQFAHAETLERARRWLIEAGIDPSRIEAHTQGVPRLSVTVKPGEAAEVQYIIDSAESADPDGNPSIWNVTHTTHAETHGETKTGSSSAQATRSESFVVSWRPQDADLEVNQTHTDLQKAYRDGKD